MPVQLSPEELELLETSRVGHLATVDETGQPHVVPVCYAWYEHALYTPIDEKPKRSPGGPLRRVQNIQVNRRVCLTVDRYDEDWHRLAWLQIRGIAETVSDEGVRRPAIAALRSRYPQYRSMRLEALPLIRISPEQSRFWRAS